MSDRFASALCKGMGPSEKTASFFGLTEVDVVSEKYRYAV